MKCPKCGHEFEIEKENNFKENRGQSQKKGMIKKSSEGRHMSRAPLGYDWNLKEKLLVPSQSSREIEEIFEEFLQPDSNLSKSAKKHNLSVNGLKKVLRNFAYVGKVKFDGQIHEGKHAALVSTILFNHVQDKLDRLKKKKN
jgi:DNA invertase Pin-like site-specific DNA recombinase